MDERQAGVRASRTRRGILAAAGATLAGIAAKQAAQPALAAYALQGDTSNTSTTTTTITGAVTSGNGVLQLVNTNTTSATALVVHCDASSNGRGVSATGTSVGVEGTCNSRITGGSGLAGYTTAPGGYGVAAINSAVNEPGSGGAIYGETNIGNAITGIVEQTGSVNNTIAVFGKNLSNMAGGVGIWGEIEASGGANTIGVFGNNLASGANGIGIYGSCANGTGIYGQTSASNQYGVLGTTYAINSTAIAGTCIANGSSAFSGGTTNPNAFAGVFQGTVVIQGKLVVSDPSYKSGALQHPDGSHRLVYCIESPESWIEDVGTDTLTNGTATVTFDKEFTAVVHTDNYHVFLTEYDGHNNLCVANRTTSGFAVHAATPGASGTFSWRVMVKGKSAVKSERLGKFAMPNLPLPDPAKIAKPPAAPVPPAPKKP